jgi:hypothetical protein
MINDPTMRELSVLTNRLRDVEHLATLALSEEIRNNPPKALMAAICPALSSNIHVDLTRSDGGGGDGGGVRGEGEGGGGMENEDERHSITKAGGENDDRTTTAKKAVMVDKIVGAWRGGRRREYGEEGGGAPCPGEFMLREEERR